MGFGEGVLGPSSPLPTEARDPAWSPVAPGAPRCRGRVPPRAAAARVHLHEAFPLQFTLPSDEPNFSFSE